MEKVAPLKNAAIIVLPLLLFLASPLFSGTSEKNPERSHSERLLASEDCGELQLVLTHRRSKRPNAYGQQVLVHRFLVEVTDLKKGLWSLELTGSANVFPRPQWFGDLACDKANDLIYIFLASQVFPDFSGRIFRLEAASQDSSESRANRASEEDPQIQSDSNEILGFQSSLGVVSGTLTDVSLVVTGPKALAYFEARIGGRYSGRLFLLNIGEGSATEVKVVPGETPRRRGVGQPTYFPPSWVEVPVPWEKRLLDEENEVSLDLEPAVTWFECLDLRDCSSTLDACGSLTAVRVDSKSALDAWAERQTELCGLEAPVRSSCEPILGCFESQCAIRWFSKDSQENCGP